jgi:hypothetical protein
MSKSKLDVRLEDKVSIKFTDYAIKNFEYDFKPGSKLRQGGVNFSNSGLKGLKLFQYRKTKKKYFIQQFWFNGKSDKWTVGEFRLDVYGVNECKKGLQFADIGYVLVSGETAIAGKGDDLLNNPDVGRLFLGG